MEQPIHARISSNLLVVNGCKHSEYLTIVETRIDSILISNFFIFYLAESQDTINILRRELDYVIVGK